jgi:hypothetical protein
MRKYLLQGISTLCLIGLALSAKSKASISYETTDHNEDVQRKINLEPQSVAEIITEIKFRTP